MLKVTIFLYERNYVKIYSFYLYLFSKPVRIRIRVRSLVIPSKSFAINSYCLVMRLDFKFTLDAMQPKKKFFNGFKNCIL